MVHFKAIIQRFGEQGEKTGWTYLEAPEEIASQLMPGNKKSFRVKGRIDTFTFKQTALMPMGGGNFIMPLNAAVRKNIGKGKGQMVEVFMEVDTSVIEICPDLMECLADEPGALEFFSKLPGSHQKYYSKWIDSAKTIETKTKRIAQAVIACSRKLHYGEMMRSLKNDNDLLKKLNT
jgi:hypothetical protein